MRKRVDRSHMDLGQGLAGLLADTYTLHNTSQNYHWNVEGPSFASLHELFERQCRELAEAIDELAGRIRSLGFYVPGTMDVIREVTRLTQQDGVREAGVMLDHLIEGHQQVAHRIRELQPLAERTVDESTMALLVERLRVHEKAAWMLRSQAGQGSERLHVAGPVPARAS